MFPVEASRELQIRVFQRLGNQQYVVTLQLKGDDGDVQSRVLEALQQGRLPSCLYRPTLEYATLAVRESLTDQDTSTLTSLTSPRLHSAGGNGSSLVATAPASNFDPPLDDDGLIDLEERRWPHHMLRSLNHAAPTGQGRDAIFWCAYDFLLRQRPAFFRTIGMLEESYLKGVRELSHGRFRAMSELQMRQSMEMERVRQQAERVSGSVSGSGGGGSPNSVFRDVQSLVAQHVGELDAVELHWQTEIEQLKVKQKTSYCDLIVDRFAQEIEQMWQAQEGVTEQVDCTDKAGGIGRPLATCNLARPLAAWTSSATIGSDLAGGGCLGVGSSMAPGGHGQSTACGCGGAPLSAGQGGSGCSEDSGGAPGIIIDDGTNPFEGRLTECAEVRVVFGPRRVFFVLRVWVGDIMDLLHGVPSAAAEDAPAGAMPDDSDGAGPQLPPDLVGPGSSGHYHFARGSAYPVDSPGWPLIRPSSSSGAGSGSGAFFGGSCGSATASGAPSGAPTLKPKTWAQGVLRSPSLRFWPTPRLRPPVRLSPNAYADKLRGLLVPTPENLKFETSQAVMLRELKARCDRVTDLHFPPLAEQLRLVRAATRSMPLRSSDYFCTRHSNLGGAVQVAFHLLTGSSEAPASEEVPAAAHRALRRIICDCHRCHVAELSMPLLLLDIGTSESSLPYAVAQRRSENVLRALKGALTRLSEELAPSEVPELQVLNLVLPPSCSQSISAGIPSVTESVLMFLRHSFQCV